MPRDDDYVRLTRTELWFLITAAFVLGVLLDAALHIVLSSH